MLFVICHFILVINSNLGRIYHCFRDMTSFPLNFLPPSFNPKFKNVSLALDRCNFACLGLRHMASCYFFVFFLPSSVN